MRASVILALVLAGCGVALDELLVLAPPAPPGPPIAFAPDAGAEDAAVVLVPVPVESEDGGRTECAPCHLAPPRSCSCR